MKYRRGYPFDNVTYRRRFNLQPSFCRSAKQELKVPLTAIDALMTELKLDRADFIKMDIEGAEKQALRGARNTVARFQPRMAIAMEHLADDPVRIPEVVFAESPTYRIACGDCIDEITKARPDVLFFR